MQLWWADFFQKHSKTFILQISRNNVSSLNQEVETQVQEAQELLTDALNIAEDMSNGTTVSEVSTELNSV